jgi:hypothetical protein
LPFIELFYKPPPIPQLLKVYIIKEGDERERDERLYSKRKLITIVGGDFGQIPIQRMNPNFWQI